MAQVTKFYTYILQYRTSLILENLDSFLIFFIFLPIFTLINNFWLGIFIYLSSPNLYISKSHRHLYIIASYTFIASSEEYLKQLF